VSVLNETLTVLGTGLDAPALILREALRFKTRSGSLIIQDATGKGAAICLQATRWAWTGGE